MTFRLVVKLVSKFDNMPWCVNQHSVGFDWASGVCIL